MKRSMRSCARPSWRALLAVSLTMLSACSEAPSTAPLDASDERAVDASGAPNDATFSDRSSDDAFQDVSPSDAPSVDATPTTDSASTNVSPADVTSADAVTVDASTMSSARLVVDAAWLTSALARDSALQVIDVRDAASYLGGHIPRAISFDSSTLSVTMNGVSNEVLDGPTVARLLGAAGIRSNVTTVVYGSAVETTTSRLVWVLHHYGLDDVHLLDGGYPSWTAAGNAPEFTATRPSAVTFTAGAGRDLIDGPTVLASLGMSGLYLVDARTATEYAAGHIPGARNVDWNSLVVSGALRAESELRASFMGVPLDAQVIVYCQSGMRGAVDWLAMRHLGYTRATLYDGSWSDWSARAYPHEP